MAGRSRPGDLSWQRSIPPCGTEASRATVGIPINSDAYSIGAWMRLADGDGSLARFFHPDLEQREPQTAEIEGWILGVS
jgi:hypothetical protein